MVQMKYTQLGAFGSCLISHYFRKILTVMAYDISLCMNSTWEKICLLIYFSYLLTLHACLPSFQWGPIDTPPCIRTKEGFQANVGREVRGSLIRLHAKS